MESYLVAVLGLAIGYVLDLLLGDPLWLPHPVVYYGKAISFFERLLRKGRHLVAKGAVAATILVGGVFSFFYLIMWATEGAHDAVRIGITALFVFFGLANRTLIREVANVFACLEKDLDSGRAAVGRIVGRDTAGLSDVQIRKAALETLSENLSDGVVAPLFYFALFGIPGIMAYKMVNTLDSMWGYKNERFLFFGRFAARLDDVANFIPARITAVLMSVVSFSWRSLIFAVRYGSKHTSPNSGYPEAALAGILGCQFGGGNFYGGVLCAKPLIGAVDRPLVFADMRKAVAVNHAVTAISVILIAVALWLLR